MVAHSSVDFFRPAAYDFARQPACRFCLRVHIHATDHHHADCRDCLDQLSMAQREHNPQFDLTGDQQTNERDRSYWITELKQSWYGDANLDGRFDTTDLVTIFQAGRFENGEAARWVSGDWDGDGLFSTSDLVVAFQDGGFERGPRAAVATVPEPTACSLFGAGMLALVRWRRHTSVHSTCHAD